MPGNPFEVFELDDLSAAGGGGGAEEVSRRIEYICLELLERGRVAFSSPQPQHQVLVDGAIRVGRTQRELRVDSHALARSLVVLQISSSLLRQRKTCTTREIYYRNKRHHIANSGGGAAAVWEEDRFKDEKQTGRTIALASHLVSATRASLGIVASCKGLCVGLVAVEEDYHHLHEVIDDGGGIMQQNEQQLQYNRDIHPIPALHSLRDWQKFDSVLCRRLGGGAVVAAAAAAPPQFILVVEKHTVLHKLAQNATFMQRFPCIAITGRGFPDLESRRFLRALCDRLPGLPVFGLCDMNPHGLAIMSTYAHGACKGDLAGEAFRYATPQLRVLGLTSADGDEYAEFCCRHLGYYAPLASMAEFAPFSAQDEACVKGLRDNNVAFATHSEWMEELKRMHAGRRKLDLDVLESVQDGLLFDCWLPRKLYGYLL